MPPPSPTHVFHLCSTACPDSCWQRTTSGSNPAVPIKLPSALVQGPRPSGLFGNLSCVGRRFCHLFVSSPAKPYVQSVGAGSTPASVCGVPLASHFTRLESIK